MAEVKQNFLKAKMNKDLDDRLVPKGEYRDAQNIKVAKSEGQDVGALENILGNNLISNFTLPTDTYSVEIIGNFMDVKNDRIVVFMTNYVDTSSDALSNFSPADAYHAIGVYEINTNRSIIIVSGRFLNFSKTQEIYNINIIDDLLFWTDNRNQPRKINIESAIGDNTYYTTEDTISVSKYYPHQTISLVTERVIGGSITVGGLLYQIANNVPTIAHTGTGTGLTINITGRTVFGAITSFTINNIGIGYKNGDIIKVKQYIPGTGVTIATAQITLTTEIGSTMHDVVSEFLPDGATLNPYRQPVGSGNITWKGDPEYLKDKFVRFSYRFKFDDGEYSLIAPFTQTCFIPKQDGYFITDVALNKDDDEKVFKSTEVDFMENKINDIELIINSPIGDWNNINQAMKVTEVDILYKQADGSSIKVIDTIPSSEFDLVYSPYLSYNYTSTKPWKTLPTRDILRVHDQVPVRAFTQEIIGNRVVYGNYIDKPTPPSSINYSCATETKELNTQIEYQNQNLKQNRNYQVGIVLSDRYGRQSTVILSSLDDITASSTIKGSTLFHEYKTQGFSDTANNLLFYPGLAPSTPGNVWDGDALNLTFWDTILSSKNSDTGEPGLYDPITNPLGWYTYKVVVKQTEQDYYNIYFPGILNGYIDGDGPGTAATLKDPTCHFVLHGDNINKVPRDLSLVGPNQQMFRSGRPSIQEDLSYYQFVNTSGEQFTVDPFSEEGEKLLKERDRERDLDSSSQVTNASVKLYLRLNNWRSTNPLEDSTTTQAYPGTNLDVVTTIGTGQELGLWDPSAISPFNTANVFYGYKNNPYVAQVTVSDWEYTGLIGPCPDSGRFDFSVVVLAGGLQYVAGSKNILCTVPGTQGQGIGFKVNIDAEDSGIPGQVAAGGLSVADPGSGWDIMAPGGTLTTAYVTGAGAGNCGFTINYDKTLYAGKMDPSLAVYETQPLKSKLNIYWETSTSGLISELNTAIESTPLVSPTSFVNFGSVPVTFQFLESQSIGSDISGPIWAIDASGAVISNPVTYTLLSVKDGANVERGNEFIIVNDPAGFPGAFQIQTNSIFVADVSNNVFGNFTFKIDIHSPSVSYLSNGTFINRQLFLSGCQLQNVPPAIVIWPFSFGVMNYASPGGVIPSASNVRAYNGSRLGAGYPTTQQGLTIHVNQYDAAVVNSTNIWTGGGPTNDIILRPAANYLVDGELEFYVQTWARVGTTYSLNVWFEDGGGLSTAAQLQGHPFGQQLNVTIV